MKNEKGFVAYHVLDSVADDLLLDALLPEDKGAVVMSPKKERPRRFFAFIQSGWGVAIVCALVAVSVMVGILWAGNRPGLVTPPAGTGEQESQTTDQTTVPLPPIFEDPDRTMMLVWSDGEGCEPERFMVWSEFNYEDESGMGHATTADGLGFLGTMRREGKKPDLPKASFAREVASQDGRIYGISLDPEYILRQVTVYDMNLNEVYTETITESWEIWDYVGCMSALTSGEYYVSFYVTHDGEYKDGSHNCGQDYAFILSVAETRDDHPEGVYVQGGGSHVIPKEAMLWIEFWDEATGTMLSGDGAGHSNIREYASELPVLTVREGLDLDVMNAEISYCVLYDQNFEILYEGKEWINTIDYVIGPFYVVFTVRTQGDYIEEADAYEGSAHEYAFGLIVSGYCDGCSCAVTE